MGIMDPNLEDWVVPVDYFGNWTPARQTFARHTEARFVEVSYKQFHAVLEHRDVVSVVQGKPGMEYTNFTTRFGAEVGRMYSDGRGITPTRRLLTREFAEKQRAVLSLHETRPPVAGIQECGAR
jgi:hypothetical protein